MERTRPEIPSPPGVLDLVEMWKSLLDGSWNSLAVVPSDQLVSVRAVVEALGLVTRDAADRVRVFDARGFDVDQVKALFSEIASTISSGKRVVIVVDSLMRSLAGAQVVRDANAVLLVIRMGGLDHESLTSTLDLVGHDRIVGAVSSGGEG
jgi:hypothetical protein